MDCHETLLDTLRSAGALKFGHFLLSSGRHSDQYVEKFDLLREPAATSAACADIVNRFRDESIDVVAGPTTGGVILAFEVARQLGTAAAYAERAAPPAEGREFRRGTRFTLRARVLVVDDILTTGGSVRETLAALAPHDVDLVGIAVLLDRSGGRVDFGVPLTALAELGANSWMPGECPLCKRGEPLAKPGTTPSSSVPSVNQAGGESG